MKRIKNSNRSARELTINHYSAQIEQSVRYLASTEGCRDLSVDAYWPKWHSPWWHMLLLHETGNTALIPEAIVGRYVEKLNQMPVKIFPIHPGDMPSDIDPMSGSCCHCQLGTVYQVLATRGVDVDAELPWIRPWFLRYQMADGGLNCDNDAYLVQGECPSSMVGTIGVFEAILLHTKRPWTPEETAFLARGAEFLAKRELRFGSGTKANADERKSAETWGELCFPRFYFYDVLRGLSALLMWAEKSGKALPANATESVGKRMQQAFPDGQVKIGRRGYESTKTKLWGADGNWIHQEPALHFPLLDAVSEVGQVSPYLSRQWDEARLRLVVS